MNYNYHTHTYRCHHASGTERYYIEEAIRGGIEYMGFSDHIPFRFPDGFESGHRMYMCDVDSYFFKINELREKFRNEIEINIGFEAEFYPKFSEQMLTDAINMGAEYFILGQHFLGNEYPDFVTSTSNKLTPDRLTEYADTVIEAMETGYFTYVAHPDIINYTKDEELYDIQMRRICKKSTELNIPLEINFLGIRTNRMYPHEHFWKIAGEEKSPVTFGFDAHDMPAAYDGNSIPVAMNLVEKYSLNYIGKPELIRLEKFRTKK